MTQTDKQALKIRIPDLKTALNCIEALINNHVFAEDGEELFRQDVRHSFMMIRGEVNRKQAAMTEPVDCERPKIGEWVKDKKQGDIMAFVSPAFPSEPVDVDEICRKLFAKFDEYANADSARPKEWYTERKPTIRWVMEYLYKEGHLAPRLSAPEIAGLDVALKNAVKPSYTFHATCANCGKESETDNGEWLIWCGDKEHAEAILEAARRYYELTKGR